MNTPDSAITSANAAQPTLRYQEQNATMTLDQGLKEYLGAMPDLLDYSTLEGESKELFTNHDLTHVVFGCDISLRQEAFVDFWTMFGSDVGIRAYMRYLRTPEAQRFLQEIGVLRALWVMVLAFPAMCRVIYRALRMKKKWPWIDHAAYLDRPLADIRRELGVTIVH